MEKKVSMPRKIIVIFGTLFFLTTAICGWVKNSSAKDSSVRTIGPQKPAGLPLLNPSLKDPSTPKLIEAQVSPSLSKETVSSPKAPSVNASQASPVRVERTSSSKSRSGSDFTLGPRDLIEISVWGNDKLKTEMPVRPDGLISFPLIGDIQAQGLTPGELREKIAVNLKKFINDPNVSVVIKEIKSDTIKISVGGEVNEPGSYEIHKPATLLHAISMAKGFTELAELKKTFLLRRGKKVRVDFFALIKNSDLSQNVFLQNKDLIYFPDNFENRINIIGEVKKPQVIKFQEGMTVLDAVLLAEGLTEIAKPTATKIYRKIFRDPGNKVIKKIQVDLGKVIFEGELSKNIKLKPGDIILIPRSFF